MHLGTAIWTRQQSGRVESPWPSTTFTKHAASLIYMGRFGPAVGGGRIVFALREQSGNIWLAEPAAAER